jgi:hypothetical protein
VKERVEDVSMNKGRMQIVLAANRIIDRYKAMGLKLTLRQLYYQFIAQDLLPASWIDAAYNEKNGLPPETKNTQKNYKRLGDVIADGRKGGWIDWDAIEDRARLPHRPSEWDDLDEILGAVLSQYRLPRWATQERYVELWVEKDALAGVLAPIATRFHITLCVNKGYSSLSAMYEAGKRFVAAEGDNRDGVLLYLGDHDPSGEDMVRDIGARLRMFGCDRLDVRKLALTMPQVQEYEPPPNPAKTTDSRYAKYAAEHGDESWEVDALPPDVLTQIISDELTELIDQDEMDKIIQREEEDKKLLTDAVKSLRKKRQK